MHGPRLRTSSCVRRLRPQHFVETVPVLEVRLKPNSDPGLPGQPEVPPKSHESGPAPKVLSGERPVCPVPSSPVRSVSAWSPKPLLVLSSTQTVVNELSQAFSGQQLAFRQKFVSELLHFSVLPSQSGSLPFEAFSILLEEIAFGSFSGLIVIPPASTWSRARNSGVRGPPPFTVSSITIGHTRSAPEAFGTSARTHRSIGALRNGSGRVVQGLSRRSRSSLSRQKTEEEVSSNTGQRRFGKLQK